MFNGDRGFVFDITNPLSFKKIEGKIHFTDQDFSLVEPTSGEILCVGDAGEIRFVSPILDRVVEVDSDWCIKSILQSRGIDCCPVIAGRVKYVCHSSHMMFVVGVL